MALEDHYSLPYIASRLMEIIEEETHGECQEEISEFMYWLSVRQFERKIINRRLAQYANGDEAWRWT